MEQARKFGATDGVNSGDADWKEQIMALTDGWGVDVAVEAVGVPQTFQMCTEIVRPGGRVANVGVHGTSVDLQLQNLWIHNIAITHGPGQQQHHAAAAQAGGQRQAATSTRSRPTTSSCTT